jgi:hypothetical protein
MGVIFWNKKLTNGNGAGGDFGTGVNWSGGLVPGSGDDASIALPGAYTVTSSASGTVTINGLQLASGANLSITGVGEIFNIRNGSDTGIGGQVNGNVLVDSGDILNITGNWSGTGRGRVYAYGTVNMGQLRERLCSVTSRYGLRAGRPVGSRTGSVCAPRVRRCWKPPRARGLHVVT